MSERITLEQLKNASLDAKTLEKFINGQVGQNVTSRTGASYPTLAEAVKNIRDKQMDNLGNFEKKIALPSIAKNGDVAFVINDTSGNNGLYRYDGQTWQKTSYANAFADNQSRATWSATAIVHDGNLYIHNRILLADNNGNTIINVQGATNPLFSGKIMLTKSASVSVLYAVARDTGVITSHTWGNNDWKNNPNLLPVAMNYQGSWVCFIADVVIAKKTDNLVRYDDSLIKLYPGTVLEDASNLVKSLGIAYEFNSGATASPIFIGTDLSDQIGKKVRFSLVVRDDTAGFAKNPAVFFRNSSGAYQFVTMTMSEELFATVRRYQCTTTVPADKPIAVAGVQTNARVYVSALQMGAIDDEASYLDPKDIEQKAKIDVEKMSQQAKNYSQRIKLYQPQNIKQADSDYNVFITYGQSLGRGNETWPSLSIAQKYGNLSLGTTTVPASDEGNATLWTPRGNSNFNPLIAQTVRSGSIKIFTNSETESWNIDQGTGESPDVGLVNHAKFLHNFAKMTNDDERRFVAINACIGGKTIEQLSKDNTQDAYVRYNRIVDSLQRAKTAAQDKSLGVPAVLWVQGEYNYADFGGVTNRTAYLTKLKKLHSDIVADVKQSTGQDSDPLFITYQTSGQFTRDADAGGVVDLHIGMSQLDFVDEVGKAVLATPSYPFTDKGGHLSNNGSRWFGMQIAKVWHKVAERGENWQPVRPVRITTNKNEIFVFYHVPEPPLVLDKVYVRSSATMATNYGFRVTDDGDTVAISNVQVVNDVCIKITTANNLSENAKLWYASAATSGHGNVRDSDPSLGSDCYEYINGMSADQNVAELVGKPYPLHNWSVAFCLPTEYTHPQLG